jgi:phospholipid/cholesterol/gamma-HCH transport system ATP-binding protein
MDPQLLLYDEPFAGLDPISMGVVLRLIKSLNDALGISSVVVTHDVREISQIADSSYILSGGQVVASGTPAELRDHPSPVVHQFMDGLADGPVTFHYPAPDYPAQLLDRSEGA